MELREHPRIQIPLLVELKHATIGTVEATARDVSEGGVFVNLAESKLAQGAKVQVTLQHTSDVETTATPTVQMVVQRVEPDGVALKFANKSYQHIWQSVDRYRSDLTVGRDYFQVYQSAVLSNSSGELLLAMENGKWLFPGHYLVVSDDWQEALAAHLRQLGVSNVTIERGRDVAVAPGTLRCRRRGRSPCGTVPRDPLGRKDDGNREHDVSRRANPQAVPGTAGRHARRLTSRAARGLGHRGATRQTAGIRSRHPSTRCCPSGTQLR